jgi:YidC/Oxa1 family membrane protein insertase
VLPKEQIAQVQPAAFATAPNNIFINDGVHERIEAVLPGGTQLGVGQKAQVLFQTPEGTPFQRLVQEKADASTDLQPRFSVTRGAERVSVAADGTLQAIAPGEATIQATIPGLAANKGFLFIKALGGVGVNGPDGIKWDVVALVLAFGLSLYVSQQLSGQGAPSNPQQDSVNRITPIIFSGMFLFFPLPAGVLMYMVIANIFQTAQTFILMREPLPEGLQKLVEEQQKVEAKAAGSQERLPFEPASKKKAVEPSPKSSGGKKKT